MRERFGDKVLQMGHLQEDGSMLVPVECVLDAVRSLGSQALVEAAETLKSEEMVTMLQSAETLVEKVSEAHERKLRSLIHEFQSQPDDDKAHQKWKQIEKLIFGVDYPD